MMSTLRTRAARRLAAAAIATAVLVPASGGMAAASSTKTDPAPQRSATYANAADDSTAFIPPNLLPMLWAYCMSIPFPANVQVCRDLAGGEDIEQVGNAVLRG